MININKDFYKRLTLGKIGIGWNKKPVEMDLFLSFLEIDVVEKDNPAYKVLEWTLYENEQYKLKITGKKVDSNEYLYCINCRENLQKECHNFVNPFYLFDIFNDEGKQFFIDYYMDDILHLIDRQHEVVLDLQTKIDIEKKVYNDYVQEKELLLEVKNYDNSKRIG